jgi:hypothetical protein
MAYVAMALLIVILCGTISFFWPIVAVVLAVISPLVSFGLIKVIAFDPLIGPGSDRILFVTIFVVIGALVELGLIGGLFLPYVF